MLDGGTGFDGGEAGLPDAVVLDRMRAAAQVLREAGLPVDGDETADDAGGHLQRALRWHRYSSCARDISRGSLRLWAMAGGSVSGGSVSGGSVSGGIPEQPAGGHPPSVQLVRVQLIAHARALCATLRADLAGEAARLPITGIGAFGARVRSEAARVTAEMDQVVAARLAELGVPPIASGEPPVTDQLPPRRRPRLESQLTTLLGAGFGCGVSLTIGRVVADLRPDWTPAAVLCCGLLGVALTCWTVAVRRLLAERAAAERWMSEAVANLRSTLEERVASRVLIAESALSAQRSRISGRRRRELRDTPN